MTAVPARLSASSAAGAPAWFVLAWLVPVLLVAVVSFAAPILNDGDTFWHLAAGRWMLDHGAVPKTDPFSFTFVGRPWVAHEWLSEVLMAGAFRAAGWSGVMLLTGLAVGLTATLMARSLLRWLSLLSAVTTLTVGLACVGPSLLARPHILALPVLAFWTLALLEARRRGEAPSLWLLPLMTLWANLHSSFIVGIGLSAAFALEAVLDYRRWRLRTLLSWPAFAFAATITALVTPHGVEGLAFPFRVTAMKSLPTIGEWLQPNFMRLEPSEVAFLAGLVALFWRGVRLTAVRAAIVLLLVHLTFQHVRQEVLLGVIAPLIVAEALGAALDGRSQPRAPARLAAPQAALAGALLAVVFVLRLAIAEVRTDGPTAPIAALAHVAPELARQPVLNSYDFGGYLIFAGVRPYIDGRADMYGDDFIAAYNRTVGGDAVALDQAIARYGIRWAILTPGQPVIGALETNRGWRRIYADRYAVVDAAPAGQTGS
ncbi:MAG: hypothetical protein JO127_05965 [Caulobacteraceae bacterium]|nr:hypothetical protein [Caulobacteraceae bacterium]